MSLREDSVVFVMKHYAPFLHLEMAEVMKVGREIPLPYFDEFVLTNLLEQAIADFKRNYSPVMNVYESVIIVGDLHGNIHDFFRIFNSVPDPFTKIFVFLGDYVDRGQFQTELATVLIALAIEYPLNIILLRGNHEFTSINSKNGFKAELVSQNYSEKIFELFNSVFSYLPIACIVKDTMLCLHGGIGPNFTCIRQIRDMTLPIFAFEDSEVLKEILWSDPSYETPGFGPSPRGVGAIFGCFSLYHFLTTNKIKMLVRGHESISSGVQSDDNKIIFTVFSSSGYKDAKCKGGYLKFDEEGKPKAFIYDAIARLLRNEACFFQPQFTCKKVGKVNSFRSLSNILTGNSYGGKRRRSTNMSHLSSSSSFTDDDEDPFVLNQKSSLSLDTLLHNNECSNSVLFYGSI